MNSKPINKKILYLFDILFFLLIVAGDRVSKYFAVRKLKDHPSISVINGFMELHYIENNGAAFGLLKNQLSFFILVAVVVLFAVFYILIKTPSRKKYVSMHMLLIMISGGAVGNLIDRIAYRYVVDFIYFSCINFPVFNVADIFVTVGCTLLIIFFIFVYKEDDLFFLNFNEKKLRDIR